MRKKISILLIAIMLIQPYTAPLFSGCYLPEPVKIVIDNAK